MRSTRRKRRGLRRALVPVTLLLMGGAAGASSPRVAAVSFAEGASPARPAALWHSFFAVGARETPYTGDFDGDGRADIITFTRDAPEAFGDVFVALSTGHNFGEAVKWHDWFAIGPSEQVLIGDFDGDGRDDLATWLAATTGEVYVSLSSGTAFSEARVWWTIWGPGVLLEAGDADGDGSDDLIVFHPDYFIDVGGPVIPPVWDTRFVLVAHSRAGSFELDSSVWHRFFAVGPRERPRVAVADGDGRDDIVTFATDSPTAVGDVYVALSDGTRFGDGRNSTKWSDWFAVGPSEQIGTGDLDGDGRDDFLTVLPPPWGQGYVGRSLGDSMEESRLWHEGLVAEPPDCVRLGDVDGDGRTDVVVFARAEGKVYVSLAP